jgi:hypothetical protein
MRSRSRSRRSTSSALRSVASARSSSSVRAAAAPLRACDRLRDLLPGLCELRSRGRRDAPRAPPGPRPPRRPGPRRLRPARRHRRAGAAAPRAHVAASRWRDVARSAIVVVVPGRETASEAPGAARHRSDGAPVPAAAGASTRAPPSAAPGPRAAQPRARGPGRGAGRARAAVHRRRACSSAARAARDRVGEPRQAPERTQELRPRTRVERLELRDDLLRPLGPRHQATRVGWADGPVAVRGRCEPHPVGSPSVTGRERAPVGVGELARVQRVRASSARRRSDATSMPRRTSGCARDAECAVEQPARADGVVALEVDAGDRHLDHALPEVPVLVGPLLPRRARAARAPRSSGARPSVSRRVRAPPRPCRLGPLDERDPARPVRAADVRSGRAVVTARAVRRPDGHGPCRGHRPDGEPRAGRATVRTRRPPGSSGRG